MRKYVIKLTDQEMRTYRDFQWKLFVKVVTDGKGGLCSAGYTHYYTHPLLAVFHNPIHAGIKNPRMWKAKVGGKCINDWGLKIGYTEGTLVKELPMPKVTDNQRIAYTIYVSLKFCKDKSYINWAKKWLSGIDRTKAAASAVVKLAGAADNKAWPAAHVVAESLPWAASWAIEPAVLLAKLVRLSEHAFEKFLIKCAKKAMKIK